jgi:cobalt-zinc-cadmium efflux system outer membrane protein
MPLAAILAPIVLLLTLSPSVAAPSELSEDQAVALFVAQSPQVAAVKQQLNVAQVEVIAAETPPNPTVDLAREQVFSAGGPTEDNRLGFQVPLGLAGKRDIRVAIARAGMSVAEAKAREQILGLTHEFRTRFTDAYAAGNRAEFLAEDLNRLGRIERVIEARVKAGESAAYDLLRVRLARAAVEARISSERVEADSQRARLAGMAGQLPAGTLQLGKLSPVPDTEDLVTYALDHRADLLSLRAERARSDQASDLALRLRWPDPSVAIGLKQTNEPTVQGFGYAVGLSWPVPLFDRGQGEAARTSAERERLSLMEEALVSRLRNDVPAARIALIQRLEALSRFERESLARLPELARIAETAYTEGDQGIVSLLDANQAALNTKLQALDLKLSAHTARLELERLVGAPLTSLQRKP